MTVGSRAVRLRRSGVFLTAIMTAMVMFVRGLAMMMRCRLMVTCRRMMMFAGWMFSRHEGSNLIVTSAIG